MAPGTAPAYPACVNARPIAPAPPPVAEGTIQDVQLRGLSRWSPRRAGVPPVLDWWPTYLLLLTLVVIALLVAGRLLVDMLGPSAHVLAVAGVATVVTFALVPVVARLERVMPRRIAVAVVFLATLCVLAGTGALVVWQLSAEGDTFTRQVGQIRDSLEGLQPIDLGPYRVPLSLQERIRDGLLELAPTIATRTAGFAGAVVASLIDLLLILVVTFYLLLDARRFRIRVLRWLDPERRPASRRVFAAVAYIFGAYVRAQITVAVSLGVLVAASMLALGVPYALFLGLFAALAELIPLLGPWIGSIPALLVALAMPFPTIVWVALALFVIQQLEANVLLPRLSAHAVGIHPVGAILALVLGFELGGVIGALFAVPIVGLLWVLVSTAVDAWRGSRFELHRRIEEQALGWPNGRPRAGARRDLRRIRSG